VNQQVLKKVNGTARENLDAVSKLLPQFLNHTFITEQHANFFGEKNKSSGPKNTAVQVNFPEKYKAQLLVQVRSYCIHSFHLECRK
jgi:hypothetical protein